MWLPRLHIQVSRKWRLSTVVPLARRPLCLYLNPLAPPRLRYKYLVLVFSRGTCPWGMILACWHERARARLAGQVGQEQGLDRVQVAARVPLLVAGRARARRKRRETTWF